MASFSQKISLEGAEEIKRLLAEIAQNGTRTFGQLQAAGTAVSPAMAAVSNSLTRMRSSLHPLAADAQRVRRAFSESMQTISSSARQAASALGRMGAVVGIGGAIGGGGLVAGLAAIAKTGLLSTESLDDLAAATGMTVEQVTDLSNAFAGADVGVEELQQAFRRLAIRVAQDWPEIQRQVRDAADKMTGAYLAVEQSLQNAAQAQENYRRVQESVSQQSIQNTNSIVSAELALEQALLRHDELTGRIGPKEAASRQRNLAIRQAELAVEEAALRLQEAKRKKALEQAEAEQRLAAARLQAQRAELELAQAQTKAREEARNDINNVTEYVRRLAQGVSTAGLDVNTSIENMVRGIINLGGEGGRSIDNLGTSIEGVASNISSMGPSARNVLLTLADVLKNVEDQSLATGIASAVLGRRVSIDVVRALQQGSAEILRQGAELRELGIGYTEADARIADSFNQSLRRLQNVATIIRDKLAVQFGPLLTDLLDGLKGSFIRNFGSIESAVKRSVAAISPFMKALGNLLRGVSIDDFLAGADLGDPFVQATARWQRTLELFLEKVDEIWQKVKAFFTQIDPATGLTGFEATLGRIIGLLDRVAEGLNKITGIKVSGEQLGIAALVGQLTGVNTAVSAIIASFITAAAVILAALIVVGGIPAAIIVAFTAAGILIGLFWDEIVAGAARLPGLIASVLSEIPSVIRAPFDLAIIGLRLIWNALPADIQAALAGVADILTSPFRIAAEQITSIWAALMAFIKSIIAAASKSPTGGGSVSDPSGGGEPFARGGYTGSIGARRIAGFVHGNEYVQPAHVVRQPGVLAFLELLRRTGDLQATIARFSRGYSAGGFVDGLNRSLSQLMIPSFASGGFAETISATASARRFGIVDLRTDAGRIPVFTDEQTVDSLQRFAVRRNVLSGGKKF